MNDGVMTSTRQDEQLMEQVAEAEMSAETSGVPELGDSVRDTQGETETFAGITSSANQGSTATADQTREQARQQAKTPRRVNPDDGRFIRIVVAGVVIAGLVAFAISFTALYEVAEWLGIPPFMWWAVPVFIDLAILVYAGSVLVHKARGERTWPSWSALGIFTGLSVFANAAHAWSHTHAAAWQGVVGAVIAGMVPVAIFVATEQLSRVAVEDPESRRSELRESALMDQAEVDHQQQLQQMRFEQEQNARRMAYEREQQAWRVELEREQHATEMAKVKARREVEVDQASRAEDQSEPALHLVDRFPPPHSSGPVSTPGVAGSGPVDAVDRLVAECAENGVEVTAAIVAEHFGVSERTGRRRLKELKEQRPEMFDSPAPDDEWRDHA